MERECKSGGCDGGMWVCGGGVGGGEGVRVGVGGGGGVRGCKCVRV